MRPKRLRERCCPAMALIAALIGVTIVAVPPVSATPATGCTVAPRPASDFVLPTDPAADTGRSRIIVEDEAQAPAGIPATAADVAAAQAFAELFTACQNAGDLRRTMALYSDAMFRDSLAARMYLPFQPANPLEELNALLFDPNARLVAEATTELAQAVAAPPAPLSPPIASAKVQEVRVLPDGRLGAILLQDGLPTEFQIYVHTDDRLLLDARVDIYQMIDPETGP